MRRAAAGTGAAPAVSLVAATLNRPAELARLVASLRVQEAGRLQLILVDQSDEAVAARNARTLDDAAGDLEIVHLRQEGRGLSRARNLGLRHARGEILCFPDDDCWYPPALLARVRAWFASHPAYDFLSGRYLDPAVDRAPPAQPAADLNTWNAFLRVASVTLFFRTARVAGELFDERLGAGCDMPVGEEIDLVLRLLRSGRRGRYDPEFVVHHPMVPFDRGDRGAFRRHEQAYGYVLARHALGGSAPVAARLILGLGKAAGRALWSPLARASLAGRCRGLATALSGAQRG